jgi:hypothetical protein
VHLQPLKSWQGKQKRVRVDSKRPKRKPTWQGSVHQEIRIGSTMAEPDSRPVTMEELLVSSLAQTDALAKAPD